MKFNVILLCIFSEVLVACGGGSDAPTVVNQGAASQISLSPVLTSVTSCGLPNFQADMLQAVNAARARPRTCGAVAMPAVGAVQWSDGLFISSAEHSQDMALRNYFDHITPEGVTAGQRANNAGYSYTNLGENIAAGQADVAAVMASWLNSPGHCENIMTAVFTDIGVACVAAPRRQYPTYWTMELAKPK
jgi:uncharacterized protein YkwD